MSVYYTVAGLPERDADGSGEIGGGAGKQAEPLASGRAKDADVRLAVALEVKCLYKRQSPASPNATLMGVVKLAVALESRPNHWPVDGRKMPMSALPLPSKSNVCIRDSRRPPRTRR